MNKRLEEHTTVVYYNKGNGYSKEYSSRFSGSEENGRRRIVLTADDFSGCKELRIDPMDCASVIKIHCLEAETPICFRKLTNEDMTTNGKILSQGMVVFASDAPQMIIQIPSNEKWKNITLDFEMLSDDITSLQDVFMAYEQEHIQSVKEYEEKYLQLLANYNEQVKPAQVSEREQLLCDKLAYIQSTTVYRKLLKNKVDSLGLWKDLDI